MGRWITHDLNTPYLDNCYVFDNLYNSGIVVSVGFIDDLEGALNIHHYSPSTGQLTELYNQYSANGTETFYNNQNIINDQYIVRLNNLKYPSQAKNVAISMVTVNNIIHVNILVRNVIKKHSVTPPHPPSPPIGCDPGTGICYDPQRGNLFEVSPFTDSSTTSGEKCTGDLATPSGFSENYNIQQEAGYMKEFSNEIDATPFLPDSIKKLQKALYFGIVMAPFSFYDLKENKEWKSSADAGNYNYGYLGAALGFERNTLIQMSGLIQLASDKVKQKQDYPLMSNLAKGITDGDFSQFDNIPEDPDNINAGYDAHNSGCIPDTKFNGSQNGSGAGGGGSSGWAPSARLFIGTSGCIGKCSIPIGKATIQDIVEQQ